MREQFRQELKAVHGEVVDILAVVTEQTRSAVQSLVSGDVDVAESVIARDDELDSRCVGVEERVLETIATQFPVARDLRLLQSLAYMANPSRADGATWPSTSPRRRSVLRVAEARRRCYDLIQAQGNLVYRVLDATGEALASSDLELASQTAGARRADRSSLQAVLPRTRATA